MCLESMVVYWEGKGWSCVWKKEWKGGRKVGCGHMFSTDRIIITMH